MLRRLSLLFVSTMFFFLCTASVSLAITFSFHEYSGAIGESYVEYDSEGAVVESTEVEFFSMDGTYFTSSDVDSHLGSYTWIYEFTQEYGGGSIHTTVRRGTRAFADGPSSLTFGPELGRWESVLSFEAAENSAYAIGQEFLLGTLTFTNGSWLVDSEPGAFTFSISASSDQVYGGEMQVFEGTILLYTNPNEFIDPEADADWLYIQEEPGLGSVRVLEEEAGDNTGSIEVWGAFGSLDLVEFRNPTGRAFLSDSVTSDPSVPVPEPSTILLFGVGILGVVGKFRRKRE